MTTLEFNQHWDKYKNLAYKCYLSYKVDSIHRDDLLQVAKIGMVKGLETYKENAGSSEITWVRLHMQKEQMEYLNKNLRTIRLPQHIIYNKERQDPLPTEYVQSLDSHTHEDGLEPLYSTIAYDEGESTEIDTSALKMALNQLKPRWREIMQMVLEGKNNKEIGDELGISREAVRLQRNNAIKKLQKIMIKK